MPAARLQGARRLDMAAEFDFGGDTVQAARRTPPLIAAKSSLLPALAAVRRMPAYVMRVQRLLAVEAAGPRELGRYSVHHQAAAVPRRAFLPLSAWLLGRCIVQCGTRGGAGSKSIHRQAPVMQPMVCPLTAA